MQQFNHFININCNSFKVLPEDIRQQTLRMYQSEDARRVMLTQVITIV